MGARPLENVTVVGDLGDAGVAVSAAVQLAVTDRLVLDTTTGRVVALDSAAAGRRSSSRRGGRSAGSARPRPAISPPCPTVPAARPGCRQLDASLLYTQTTAGSPTVPVTGADVWKSDTGIAVTATALYVTSTRGGRTGLAVRGLGVGQ
ncbi:MAG: hypothetical protein U0531_06765 [Dehalococcoidia bacterium]